MTPPNTFVAEVDASCRNFLANDRGDPLAGMSVTATDVRGDELGLLVYTSEAGAGAVCWSGTAGPLPNVTTAWDEDLGRDAGDLRGTELCLRFNNGNGQRDPAHAVVGQHGDEIASVVVEGTVRGRVEATTVNGWFLAWWPGEEQGPTQFRILGLDGIGQPVADLMAARDAQHEDWPCSPD
jgi:hypothetical protein